MAFIRARGALRGPGNKNGQAVKQLQAQLLFRGIGEKPVREKLK